ncbi:hypothetical protein STEG23_014576 [Scotinomys teguina]
MPPLYFPEALHRRTALEQDVAFWYDPHWQETIPYTLAIQHYVRRLHEVGHTHPELLVAHTYTCYLGDLSGGQVLKKIAQKALDLPSSGEGLVFFTFPNIDNPTKFQQLYRARMNTLEMTPEVKHRGTEEAKTAFLLNIKLFEELQSMSLFSHKDINPSPIGQATNQDGIAPRLKPEANLEKIFMSDKMEPDPIFLTDEFLAQLFVDAGYEEVANEYVFREMVNKKEGLCVPLVFLQSKFRKLPKDPDPTIDSASL